MKWQAMGAKRRYDSTSFTERSVHSHDLLDDEIDLWIPFDDYYNRHCTKLGHTLATCRRDFEVFVNGQRQNCRIAMGAVVCSSLRGPGEAEPAARLQRVRFFARPVKRRGS